MKILFLIGATSRIRNFHEALMRLADDGHTITLAGRLRKGAFELPKTVAHARISGRVNPTQRGDGWRDFVDLLRGARDYVRYFDPRYAQATRLVRRAYEIAPTEFVLFCERNPWVKRHWSLVARALAFVETLIPSDPDFERFLEEEQPDLVVVTPLVTFESYQTDYVKSAHGLGIPVLFIPFSWDNLTNKGLMRVQPDRVLVWNDVQRREAVDLHGCRPDDVVIVGASRFDDFFDRSVSTTYEAFAREWGLDPDRPLVLYMGSSQLTGPNEMELIRRWAEAFRASDDPLLRECNLLIRPHPALKASWASVDYADLPRVAVSRHASRNADQELFDSLHHARAAVGLNTSAMLEAAIVGTPVHTLLIPGFDEGQKGTMHFHYLVEAYGGLATIARDLPEHLAQMAALLRQPAAPSEKSRAFAGHFLRPHGIDRRVAPILAEEIARAGQVMRRARTPEAGWHAPLRRLLLGWLQRRRTRTQAETDGTIVGTSLSLRPVRTALEELRESTTPIFVGPWNDSVQNELLYWIPFLRWVTTTYGLPPERLFVISNGRAGDWYHGIGQRYLDARTLFSPPERQYWAQRSVPQSEYDAKQAVMPPFDAEILERATRAFDLSEYQVLHPSLLFRVITRIQKDRTPERLPEVLRPARLAGPERIRVDGIPESFVAMSLAFTDALPRTDENAAFLGELVAEVASERPVVVVDTEPAPGVDVPDSARVCRLSALAPDASWDTQTAVLARAAAFVGAHGDLAVLAAACGVPVVSYQSEKIAAGQLEQLQALATSAEWGGVSVERARRFKGVRLPVGVRA